MLVQHGAAVCTAACCSDGGLRRQHEASFCFKYTREKLFFSFDNIPGIGRIAITSGNDPISIRKLLTLVSAHVLTGDEAFLTKRLVFPCLPAFSLDQILQPEH